MKAILFNEWMVLRGPMSLCNWKLPQPLRRGAQEARSGGTHSVRPQLPQPLDGQRSGGSAPVAASGRYEAQEGSPGRRLCHRGHAGRQREQNRFILLTSPKELAGNIQCI